MRLRRWRVRPATGLKGLQRHLPASMNFFHQSAATHASNSDAKSQVEPDQKYIVPCLRCTPLAFEYLLCNYPGESNYRSVPRSLRWPVVLLACPRIWTRSRARFGCSRAAYFPGVVT